MILLSLIACSLSWGNGSSDTIRAYFPNQVIIQKMQGQLLDLTSGRPTITGYPSFQGGFVSSGPVTLSSTTINGILLVSSSITVNGNLFGNIYASNISSSTTMVAISQATIGPCVTASTISHTNISGKVRVSYNGGVTSASTNIAALAFLIDGAYPTGMSSVADFKFEVQSIPTWTAFSIPVTVAPGTHNYCLTGGFSGGGNITIPYTTNAYNVFSVEEY